MLNEWSAGGTNALSLNIGESEAPKYGLLLKNSSLPLANTLNRPCVCREEGEEEDGDIPDDEQINSMMASYDGEMEMYQMMDAERERNRKAWWGSQHPVGKSNSLPQQPTRLSQAW